MVKKCVFSLIVSVLIALSGPSNAYAWFNFTNSTSETVWVAFQWYSPDTCQDDGYWRTKGWWKLQPGETKTVFGQDLQSVGKYYYYYAETSDSTAWAGNYNTYVSYNRFDWCLDLASTNSRIVGFREVYIGNNNNYTIRLTY